MSQSFDASETIKQIIEAFSKLNDIEKIKAFSQLAQMRGTEGASAIMDLLHQYANSGTLPQSIMWSLNTVHEHADIYFPELLNYAQIPMLGHRIYALCAIYLSCKWLSSDKLESRFDLMKSHYQSLKNQWGQKDNYADKYYQIYHLLEIFRYFPKPEVEAELYDALDLYNEAGLKYQVVSSLWRLGKPVDDKYILDLIVDDLMRWSMFWRLQERGELSLFPEQYRTAEASARSLVTSTIDAMYASRPDSIEFVQVSQINSSREKANGDYYIYRILTDFGEGSERKWVTAWAGPVQTDFDFFKMSQSQVIFNDFGVGWEQWDYKPSNELVMKHFELFHKHRTG